MNRHERRKADKALKKGGPSSANLALMDKGSFTQEQRKIFLGEGNLPLTPELIKELIEEKGLKEEDLNQFAEMGAQYCPSRNSFIMPPEDF